MLEDISRAWLMRYFAISPQDTLQSCIACCDDDMSLLDLPANFQLHGYGDPIYVNDRYEFDKNPPHVPANNECAHLRKRISHRCPADEKSILHIGAPRAAIYIFIDRQFVAYHQDSKTEPEIDITQYVKEGNCLVDLLIFRWCDGSYLECQDFWRLSGVEREVYVWQQPLWGLADICIDADWEEGRGTLSIDILLESEMDGVDVEVVLKDGQGNICHSCHDIILGQNCRLDSPVLKVTPWSPEIPTLYRLDISLHFAGSKLNYTFRVGFRRVEIADGLLEFNGQYLTIKGVNRHEHSAAQGHVIDEKSMLEDIALIKAAHINAVRNSHYPNHRRWYQLCDEYGLLLVDEANIESHGMGYGQESLAKDPAWQAAHLHRVRNMYHRSKNHSSVVIWSLGNEAGYGVNFISAYKWLKGVDPSRPIQYEQASADEMTDIYCPMYPSIEDIEHYAQAKAFSKPLIMCEYAHAMGNSLGNFSDYWAVINRHDTLQGGFVWDWCDQGLRAKDDRSYCYGGHYGKNLPSDANFCLNGIVDPDRHLHPTYYELQYCYQPLQIRLEQHTLHLRSLYQFKSIDVALVLGFTSKCHGTSSEKMIVTIPARQETMIDLSAFAEALAASQFLKVDVYDDSHFHHGHEQFVLAHAHESLCPQESDPPGVVLGTQSHTSHSLVIAKSGLKMIESSEFCFWRAPVDNDMGYDYYRLYGACHEPGWQTQIDLLDTHSMLHRSELGEITTQLRDDEGIVNYSFELQLSNNRLDVPRIGLLLKLSDELNSIKYWGKGPRENYSDRHAATWIDWHHLDPTQMSSYIAAQEYGHRIGVETLDLIFSGQERCRIAANSTFEFSFTHFHPSAMSQQTRGDLRFSDIDSCLYGYYLCIDLFHMGVGGTDSWGARPLEQYLNQRSHHRLKLQFS